MPGQAKPPSLPPSHRFCRLHCTLIATGRDYPHAAYQCPGWARARPMLPATPATTSLSCCLLLCGKKSLKVIHCNAWRCRGCCCCCISLRQLWAAADPLFDGSTHHCCHSLPPTPLPRISLRFVAHFCIFSRSILVLGLSSRSLLVFFCGASRRTLCKCIRRDY